MSVQAIAWVLGHSKSSNTARCVMLSIANHLNPDGVGWVYVDRVLREANCSLNSYHRAIHWALDNGELERVEHGGGYETTHERHRPNLYRFPALQETDEDDGRLRGTQFGGEGGTQFGGEGGTQNGEVNSKAVSKAVSKAKQHTSALEIERTILAVWCEVTGRNPGSVRMTSQRQAKILARLKEGYPPEDLVDAVRGVALSPFHMGDNDRKQTYNDLTTVLRDGAQVEKFRDLYRQGPAVVGPKAFRNILAAVEKLEGVRDATA
jgi:hypothetical protein